jgi:hypothetical protein
MQVAEPCPTQYEPLDKDKVEQDVLQKVKVVGPFRDEICDAEVTYFFHDLGLHHYYFSTLSTEMIANHVLSLIGNKLLAKTSGSAWVYEQLGISLASEAYNIATFAAKSNISTVPQHSFPRPGGVQSASSTVAVHHAQITESRAPSDKLEHFLESNYFAEGVDEPTSNHLAGGKTYEKMHKEQNQVNVRSKRRFRLQSFLSSGVLDPEDPVNLKIFMLQAPDFQDSNPPAGAYTIDRVSDKGFFQNASKNLKRQTQSLLTRSAEQRLGPVVSVETWEELREAGAETGRLLILYTHGSTHSFFTGVSTVYRYHGLYSVRKYVEQFSNAKTMYNIYLRKLSASQTPLRVLMQRVANDCMLHYVLPRTSISGMLETRALSPSEHAYAYSAWKFVYHFGRMTSSLHRAKRGSLRTAREVATELLDISEASASRFASFHTEADVLAVIFAHPKAVKLLYLDFQHRYSPHGDGEELTRSVGSIFSGDQSKATSIEKYTFELFLGFNRAILKTNFYKREKVALTFAVNPAVLPELDYPHEPTGVHMVVGAEFRAFFVSFSEISRGSVSIVKSGSPQAFASNCKAAFDETYGLALLQHRKSKDVAEGGSHGIILLGQQHQSKRLVAFQKYVSSMLELMTPSPDIRDYTADGVAVPQSQPPRPPPLVAAVPPLTVLRAAVQRSTSQDSTGSAEDEGRPSLSADGIPITVASAPPRPSLSLAHLSADTSTLLDTPRGPPSPPQSSAHAVTPSGAAAASFPLYFLEPSGSTPPRFMDWAGKLAKSRGYIHWKAFAAGKSKNAGGIPLNDNRMANHSLRRFISGIESKDGIEGRATKVLRGGAPSPEEEVDADVEAGDRLRAVARQAAENFQEFEPLSPKSWAARMSVANAMLDEVKRGVGQSKVVAVIDDSGLVFDPNGIPDSTLQGMTSGCCMADIDADAVGEGGSCCASGDYGIHDDYHSHENFHLHHELSADMFIHFNAPAAAVNSANVSEFLYGNDKQGGERSNNSSGFDGMPGMSPRAGLNRRSSFGSFDSFSNLNRLAQQPSRSTSFDRSSPFRANFAASRMEQRKPVRFKYVIEGADNMSQVRSRIRAEMQLALSRD